MNCAAFIVACVVAQPGNVEEANPPTICGAGQISAYVCQRVANEFINHLPDGGGYTLPPEHGYLHGNNGDCQ